MAGNGTIEPITEEEAKELERTLEAIRGRVSGAGGPNSGRLDERSIKPLQDLLAQDSSPDVVRLLDYGLAEILAAEFDLDWARAERDGAPQVVLQIPFSEHVLYPSAFFSEQVKKGKIPNVRTTYLHWSDWINEHQFEV